MIDTKVLVYAAAVLVAAIVLVVVLDEISESDSGDYTLPVIRIETEDGESIESKDAYVDCEVTIINTDSQYRLDGADGKIRGRGNSSWDKPSYWYMPKKSYKLVMDEAVDMFGNGTATTWTLIANYVDPSLSRNYMAYSIGSAIGLEFTTSTQSVNVYLNGLYQGVYLMCEQVEVGEGRVDIDTDTSKDQFGFLVEMDGWIVSEGGIEGLDYFAVGGNTYTIRSHDREDGNFDDDDFQYVKGYIASSYDAVRSGDYAMVQQYIDVRSFALTYIVNELFHTKDISSGSVYMYKDQGGKLTSGPLWDFDQSSGNNNNLKANDTKRLWAATENCWYAGLLEYDEFRALVAEELRSSYDTIIGTMDDCMEYLREHRYDFKHNFSDKWPMLGALTGTNPLQFLTMDKWKQHIIYLYNWLESSLDYMVSVYCA